MMDLGLSDDQELFCDTTSKFLADNWSTTSVRKWFDDPVGLDRDMWVRGAELGWTSMLVPEEFGGGNISGEGVCDLAIVVELLGRSLFAGPVIPTNVVAFALAKGARDDIARAHLPGIAEGRTMAAWAASEENDRWTAEGSSVTVSPADGGFRLTGVKTPVQDAHVADLLLISTRDAEGVTQFLVPADTTGVIIDPLESLDLTRRYGRVRLDDVEVPASHVIGRVHGADADLERQFALAVALQCAETVGATDAIFDITLQYTKDRKAFGRPIGSYQALKHRLADMVLWLESSKAMADAAVKAVQFDVDAANAASRAKTYIAAHCPLVVRDCLQMHGGIGYTWEHDLHLYLRRVETNSAIWGGPDFHRDRLAVAVGL
jgi:alkylation response protein AidB-like acyl-CoA dehydrogenase